MTEDFIHDAMDSLHKGEVRHILLAWIPDIPRPAWKSADVRNRAQVAFCRQRINAMLDELDQTLQD